MPKERREIDKEVAQLHSILMQTQNNLLLIEGKRAEFIDPESVPPDLQNAEEALRARVIEIQKRIEAVKKAYEAIDSVDLLTLSVKDDLASIGKEGMKSEQVEVIEHQKMNSAQFSQTMNHSTPRSPPN